MPMGEIQQLIAIGGWNAGTSCFLRMSAAPGMIGSIKLGSLVVVADRGWRPGELLGLMAAHPRGAFD